MLMCVIDKNPDDLFVHAIISASPHHGIIVNHILLILCKTVTILVD